MKPNKKPSILYWGKKLINFSIFPEKNRLKETSSKTFKKETNTNNPVVSSRYGVVMLNV